MTRREAVVTQFHGPFDPLRREQYDTINEDVRQGRWADIRFRCCILAALPVGLILVTALCLVIGGQMM